MNTMAHQNETQPTLTRGESSTPKPTEQILESHVDVALYIESMFDDYVVSEKELPEVHEYIVGYENDYRTAEQKKSGEAADRAPIYNTIPKQEIIDARLNDLRTYVKGALFTNDILVDLGKLRGAGLVSIDDICQDYIEKGINRAQNRYTLRTAEYPAHITVGTENDFDLDTKFIEIVKTVASVTRDLGAAAIHAIRTVSLHSQPTPTQKVDTIPTQHVNAVAIDSEALHDDLTGKALTVTMGRVRP